LLQNANKFLPDSHPGGTHYLTTYLSRRAAIVDLPLPEDPTMATVFPAGRCRLKFLSTTCSGVMAL